MQITFTNYYPATLLQLFITPKVRDGSEYYNKYDEEIIVKILNDVYNYGVTRK